MIIVSGTRLFPCRIQQTHIHVFIGAIVLLPYFGAVRTDVIHLAFSLLETWMNIALAQLLYFAAECILYLTGVNIFEMKLHGPELSAVVVYSLAQNNRLQSSVLADNTSSNHNTIKFEVFKFTVYANQPDFTRQYLSFPGLIYRYFTAITPLLYMNITGSSSCLNQSNACRDSALS